jgi:beta-glucanase (GH16 family)|tara:strand:- start:1070 stop:2044 length:975 start_codon:yes stop_codon:yes gene_type:complete
MDKSIILISFILLITSCTNNGEDEEVEILGCMDVNSLNYNEEATEDDGSCSYYGCTDSSAINYNMQATIDDGNCLSEENSVPGFSLFWNDEFNADNLNLQFWNIERFNKGTFNNESQSYVDSKDNIILIDGKLYIRAKKESPFDPNNPVYTSGRINTKNKVEVQYGYWEVRAKLPTGVGTWPAIWMLNSNIDTIGWPNCGEIDIMEHVGYDSSRVFFSIHNANMHGDVGGTNQQSIYDFDDNENDFNTYAVEWAESYIKGYVNGILYFHFDKSSELFNDWPYDNPFFLIINLAIGGDWGGVEGIDTSIFPASFIIDYVRMYVKS